MSQGNAFGRSGGRWMTTTKLRAAFNGGLTYDEIAELNFKSEGWRPTRSAVKKKLDLLNFPPRNQSHRTLIPWKVKPEHNSSELRHMLQAESRRRNLKAGEQLSESDRSLTEQLHNLLFGRGRLMVVAYHPEIGFYVTPRIDEDDDIVRLPRRARSYADPDLTPRQRGQVRASSADAGFARTQPSSTR